MSSEVGPTTMNQAEVDGILTQLNDLKGELSEGRVGPECPRKSDSKLSHTICDIRGLITCKDLYCFPNDQGTDFRGIKLVTSTLKDIKAVCHGDLDYEVVDNSILKEQNLSDEMTKCIEEAHAALEECKQLRRCIQNSREESAKQAKDAPQKCETWDEKRMRRFVAKTKDIVFQLHYDVFGSNFLEDDNMIQTMDTIFGGNEQLRLLYLSGKTVKKCCAELDGIKSILKQILADCSVREDLEASVSIKAISNDIRDEVAELANSSKKTTNEEFEVMGTTAVQKTENELLLSTYEQTKSDLDKLQAKYEKLQTETRDLTSRYEQTKTDLDELQAKYEKLQNENRDLTSRQQQKESEELQTAKQTTSSLNEDIKSSRTRCEQKDREYRQIQNDLAKIQEDNKDLIKRRSVTEKELEEKRKDVVRLKEVNANLITKLDGKEGELKSILKDVNMLQHEKGDLLNRSEQTDKEYRQIQNDFAKTQEDNKDLLQRGEKREKEYRQIQNDLAKIQQENKELLKRLSQSMSAQLTYNNPNVADLSDPNRPTKLAEQYSELYDNEWTDAFQKLKSYSFVEETIIGKLLHILCQAYEYCSEAEKMQVTLFTAGILHPSMKKLKKILTNPEIEYQKDCQSQEILEKQALQTIAQLSKKHLATSAENLKQDFFQSLKEDNWMYISPNDYRAYAEKCIDVCWSMVLQNPPLVIESSFDTVDSFDTKKYRFYQKSGKQYKYIVWPVLYLHRNGPILTQGVAEPDSTE